MEHISPIRKGLRTGTAAGFIVLGLALYALLFAAAEWLVYRNGQMNPIFKIETAERQEFDWVILGASHAMPLDFDDFNDDMERRTGKAILNLAGPGTGPLYNRFALEHFLYKHRALNVLYVADSFAFRSPMWNEERLSDAKLLARTPFSPIIAGSLVGYVMHEGVDPLALLDYLTGFSKINNRRRFSQDVWEGEASFDRAFKPSATAEKKRVEYLYPPVTDEPAIRDRYFRDFTRLIATAKHHGARVTVAKFPLPPRFKALLRDEAEFGAALQALAIDQGVAFVDFSDVLTEFIYYADTDHLNRAGLSLFFELHLMKLFMAQQ
ncbi:SGNH/GDSL hydrolase family protein [Chelativorans xinjiangense]|uniref:SGNH/GDSL hydrolase family protein n=1 Tax=Chelativorans xinjiangense TaxID=2681485 RepID=UPI0013586BC4|nr:SGNH/GDSL hydrolase family protein [Chelativorans xinjiangense]